MIREKINENINNNRYSNFILYYMFNIDYIEFKPQILYT